VYLVAIGKVAWEMAKGAQSALHGNVIERCIIGKGGVSREIPNGFYFASDHPIPGPASLAAGEAVLEFAKRVPAGSRVLVLLSGGASALMECLMDGVDLETFRAETKSLMDSGADIFRLNEHRKSRSRIKAGGLGRALAHANVDCLVLSDVYGNDLDTIGSGPLRAPGIRHTVIGDNRLLLERAKEAAISNFGIQATISGEWLAGEAREVGRQIAREATPGLTIYGGEPVVTVTGNGVGGRCSEVALGAALELIRQSGVHVLAANTDGTDGNAEYSFAYADGNTVDDIAEAKAALTNNDSFTYLKGRDCIIHGGPGLSNVNDLYMVYRT